MAFTAFAQKNRADFFLQEHKCLKKHERCESFRDFRVGLAANKRRMQIKCNFTWAAVR